MRDQVAGLTGGTTVAIARTAAELERLAPLWSAIPWEREEAELPYLVARVEEREGAAPFAIVVSRDGAPAAALAGRVESRRFATDFGSRTLYAPRLRTLQIVDGGLVAPDPGAIPTLVAALREALADGSAEVAAIPPLPLDSELFRAFSAAGGRLLGQQRFLTPWERRLLVLPGSFEEYLASRSGKVRFGIRYDSRKLLGALGEELSVEVFDRPEDGDRLIADLECVARSTYQRSIGAGFADTAEQRRLITVGLEHGWTRAHVLYRGERPIAFWLCAIHGERLLLKTTGFDPAYLRLRVGVYLLMRVIEDACADPALSILDFGPGDADYKRHLSSTMRREQNLLLFAPTPHARGVNLVRTGILAAASVARRSADRAQLTERLKARRRRRLRA